MVNIHLSLSIKVLIISFLLFIICGSLAISYGFSLITGIISVIGIISFITFLGALLFKLGRKRLFKIISFPFEVVSFAITDTAKTMKKQQQIKEKEQEELGKIAREEYARERAREKAREDAERAERERKRREKFQRNFLK